MVFTSKGCRSQPLSNLLLVILATTQNPSEEEYEISNWETTSRAFEDYISLMRATFPQGLLDYMMVSPCSRGIFLITSGNGQVIFYA